MNTPASPSRLSEALQRLKKARLRLTRPRHALLEVLASRDLPIAIEELHAQLRHTRCDLVTVYRCLANFEEAGLVRRTAILGNSSLYELTLDDSPRYYVACRGTEQLQPIDRGLALEFRRIAREAEASLAARGYTKLTHVIEFFGVSPEAPPRPAAE